jgi:uncharacterized BrkB/YihY/UPF0761 family membrane protein
MYGVPEKENHIFRKKFVSRYSKFVVFIIFYFCRCAFIVLNYFLRAPKYFPSASFHFLSCQFIRTVLVFIVA